MSRKTTMTELLSSSEKKSRTCSSIKSSTFSSSQSESSDEEDYSSSADSCDEGSHKLDRFLKQNRSVLGYRIYFVDEVINFFLNIYFFFVLFFYKILALCKRFF